MSNEPFVMPGFTAPLFPEARYDIRDYGAQSGGVISNTDAFREAVAECHISGGTVVVPAGVWLTGPIHLLSNVRLHLEKGAEVRFSTRFADYLPVVFTRWEGVECYNYSPLIYAIDGENIAVTGEGTFEGQGEAWWHWKKLQQAAAQELYDAQSKGIPVSERLFGTEAAALRPQFLQFVRCRNLLVEGVTFRNGPMWTIHPVYCENVAIRGVMIETRGPNTDGINPDSCRNVRIEDCTFDTGDDCVAINSGMNEDGWRVAHPCEDILVQNCTMREGHGAVSIGSGMSGDVRRVWIRNCRITGGEFGLRIKSMRGRGGIVEQVWMEDLHFSNLRHGMVLFTMYYDASTAPSRSDAAPLFRKVTVRRIVCESAETGIVIKGLPERFMEAVTLEDVQLQSERGISCQWVDGLTLKNVRGLVAQPPVFDCAHVRGLTVIDSDLE